MIFSMTGFAAQQMETEAGTLALELRSVNHRYLELQLRIDESLRVFESQVREVITARLGRGKVECRLTLYANAGSAVDDELSQSALARLAALDKRCAITFRIAARCLWPKCCIGPVCWQPNRFRQKT
jgi:uncharacterized protein (TIGR00255 family)